MEGDTEALASADQASEPVELEPPALRRARHRRDPRAAGRHAGGRRTLRARRRRARRLPGAAARAPRGHARARPAASGGGDPLPPPGGLLGQRDGRVEGARRADPRRRPPRWPPCAASPTATSARPTRTGPTRCSRWPTGAPRRSATRCSTRSPSDTGIEERATLYSSTEFKKIRLLYFTEDFKNWEPEHARLSATAPAAAGATGDARRSPTRARPSSTSAHCELIPGGVNSPVRAMRAIGREPIFIERGEGAELIDVDGNRFVDYVCSWGPLIHGHAHPRRARGGRRGDAPRGHELRRAHGRRGGARRRGRAAHGRAWRCCA